jgi:hypothetical protein
MTRMDGYSLVNTKTQKLIPKLEVEKVPEAMTKLGEKLTNFIQKPKFIKALNAYALKADYSIVQQLEDLNGLISILQSGKKEDLVNYLDENSEELSIFTALGEKEIIKDFRDILNDKDINCIN